MTGVNLIEVLFNPTSNHPTPPSEMAAVTQPATTTTAPQHPAHEHTGMALVTAYNVIFQCCAVLK